MKAGDDLYRLQAVQLGIEYQGRRVVLGGVRESDIVVTGGAFHLNNERKRQALGSQ